MDNNRFEVLRTARVTIVHDECQARYEVIYYFSESSAHASVEYFYHDATSQYYTRQEALKAAMEYALIFI